MDDPYKRPDRKRKVITIRISKSFYRMLQRIRLVFDTLTPYTKSRWGFGFFLVIMFIIRICIKQGWYIVCYALGIYHLNLFIAFLTPKMDPALDLDAEDGPELPTKSDEEFKPFVRRLPEYKCWLAVTKSTIIAFTCTFFDFFNVPVFWPILVMYFVTLFCITMKRQIKHMIKYRYLPFTHNKPKYTSKVTTN